MNSRDPQITLDQTGLRLRHYYFPLATTKEISVERIESIKVAPLTFRTGKWRVWGSTTLKSWMPLDLGRSKKPTVIFVDDGHRITSGITPANPQDFIAVLTALNPKIKVLQRK